MNAPVSIREAAAHAFCASDLATLGRLQEMTRRRVRVPDLTIVGYDGIEFAAPAAR